MNIFFMACLMLMAPATQAQIPGRWEGTLTVRGQTLPIIFELTSHADGKLTATLDVPAQGAKGIPCDSVRVQGDSLQMAIKAIGGSYGGRFNADRTRTTGQFRQGAFSLPLDLKRTGEVLALVRPQTPKAPFPYLSQEVDYDNPTKTVHLGATLTKPAGSGPFPLAILITGSGPQDRDETIFGHKPFWVLADYLTRRGIAVLRVDDRNAGKSTGPLGATSADFAQDVLLSLDYVKSRPDINPKKIGLIGHSEGGLIAPMVAAQRPKDIAFVVSLAGPGEKIEELMIQQNLAVLESTGVAAPVAQHYVPLLQSLIHIGVTQVDTALAYAQADEAFSAWRQTVDSAVVRRLTQVSSARSQAQYVRTMINAFQPPWSRYFFRFDPRPYLVQLSCPVLALNGEKDIQVVAKPNLAGWEAALRRAKNRRYIVREMPGLNHLFQHCQSCRVDEYGELSESFAAEALAVVGDWLVGVVLP